MKTFFMISCVLATFQIAFSTKCPIDSAKWCDNIDVSEACQVTKQCIKYVWLQDSQPSSVKLSDNVNFTLYYETLCPDCRGIFEILRYIFSY